MRVKRLRKSERELEKGEAWSDKSHEWKRRVPGARDEESWQQNVTGIGHGPDEETTEEDASSWHYKD